MVTRLHLIAVVLIGLTAASIGQACNIPVFRYALERWKPDSCQVIVFHDGNLNKSQQAMIRSLNGDLESADMAANGELLVEDVTAIKNDEHAALWESVRKSSSAKLPHVVVRTKLGRGQWINHWQSSLEKAASERLTTSPLREKLRDRLLAGHSIVWVMLKSNNETTNRQARERITKRLEALSRQIKLPEGIGLPGSELYADVPLVLKFSLLEIDADDAEESFLVRLLTGFDPEAHAAGEPLVVPVFGRGRALEVIPASTLSDNLIDDLTMYLSAACSCQVKEQNPGFDILIKADWETDLFGSDGDRPPDRSDEEGLNRPPVTLPIPPGR